MPANRLRTYARAALTAIRTWGAATPVKQAAEPQPRRGVVPPAPSRDVEPFGRQYLDWTPELIRAAEIQANGGTLRMAADLCDWVLRDDRVSAVLSTRTDALLGLPFSFETGRGPDAPTALAALDVEGDWWAAYPEVSLRQLQAWGLILGIGVARQHWEEREGRAIPRLAIHHPRNLRWDDQSRKWMIMILDEPGGGQHEVEVDTTTGEWILYTPYSSPTSRPWAYGAWLALSQWVLLKWCARQDLGNYTDRLGSGIWLATGGDSKETRAEIRADIDRLGRNAVLAIPTGFDLKLIESQARTWEAFLRCVELCDQGVAVALLGQNLTTQNDGGSQAATTEHGKVALGRTKADAQTFSTCLHDQSLTFYALFNWGDPQAAPWPHWNAVPTQDRKDLAGTLQMLSQAVSVLRQAGAPIDLRAMLASFDVPMLPEAPAEEKQGQIFAYHLGAGVVTINEVRASIGLPPVEGGDRLLSSTPAAEPAAPAAEPGASV